MKIIALGVAAVTGAFLPGGPAPASSRRVVTTSSPKAAAMFAPVARTKRPARMSGDRGPLGLFLLTIIACLPAASAAFAHPALFAASSTPLVLAEVDISAARAAERAREEKLLEQHLEEKRIEQKAIEKKLEERRAEIRANERRLDEKRREALQEQNHIDRLNEAKRAEKKLEERRADEARLQRILQERRDEARAIERKRQEQYEYNKRQENWINRR
ncbi:MAG: hypothetical protein JSR91_10860 [Proteobacteria bacterium]|nr:hypothetical protein [Pseudomonadota bacterium]